MRWVLFVKNKNILATDLFIFQVFPALIRAFSNIEKHSTVRKQKTEFYFSQLLKQDMT